MKILQSLKQVSFEFVQLLQENHSQTLTNNIQYIAAELLYCSRDKFRLSDELLNSESHNAQNTFIVSGHQFTETVKRWSVSELFVQSFRSDCVTNGNVCITVSCRIETLDTRDN